MASKSIKTNALLNIIKTCSSIIFPLITFPYVLRILLPDNIGKINFGIAYVSYFSLIASLGVTTYAIRECSRVRDDKNELNKTASQIYSINICTTIIAYLLLIISLIYFGDIKEYRILILIQSVSILFMTIGADWINSAMEDFEYITLRTLLFQILALVLMFIFVRKQEDYLIYAGIMVFMTSGANIMNYFYRKRFCTIKFVRDMEWNRHFAPICYLFVMIMAQTVFSNADITMLGLMRSDYEVGVYSTAVKMTNLIAQIVSSIAWVIMPRLSQYFAERDFGRINELLRKALSVLLTIGIPSAIGAMCMAEDIIRIIAGDKYVGADVALCILMVAFLFSLVGGSFLGNMVLLSSKKEKLYMIICCIAAVFNVVANYILIPQFGADGAAMTTTASSVLILIMLVLTVDKRIKLSDMLKEGVSPCVGSVGIVVVCSVLKNIISNIFMKFIVCVVISSIVYLVVLILMKNQIVYEIFNVLKARVLKRNEFIK